MASYKISLLDKSPVGPGGSASDALRNTVRLAQRAEALGYHRFWVAEHHSAPQLAGAAPEILVAHIVAQTNRIRVGTGGVMLQHYSPFKVAEVFKVLEALAPGRVDLGIGKAPGGLPLSTRALQAQRDPARGFEFDQAITDLDGFLTGELPDGHPLAGAVATPDIPALPQRFLLGGSPDSARLAAKLGWEFCYAGHFNGDPASIEAAFQTYSSLTGKTPSLALYGFASASGERAASLVGDLVIYTVHLPDGRRVNLPSLEAAAEFARQAGVTDYRTEKKRPHVIAGTPDRVRRELDTLARRFGVTEFIIDNPVADFAERLASVELLGSTVEAEAA